MPIEDLPPNTYYLDPFSEIVGFRFGRELIIDGGVDVNVYDAAEADDFNVDSAINLRVRVTGDVTHLIWDNRWTVGSTFRLTNQATIFGKAGAGGDGGRYADRSGGKSDGENGADGGPAIELSGSTVSIDNESGNIWGGGGGGGGGPGITISAPDDGWLAGAGGGSGRGGDEYIVGENDAGLDTTPPANVSFTEAVSPSQQTGGTGTIYIYDEGGVGGLIGLYGGDGGNGGGFGESGAAGTTVQSTVDGGPRENVDEGAFIEGEGGAAGKAIELGGGSVTWLAGNTSERVKGAVS